MRGVVRKAGRMALIQNRRISEKPRCAARVVAGNPPVGLMAGKLGQRAAGANDGLKQPSGSQSIAEFQTIGDQTVDAQMPSQRPHNMVQTLAHEHDRSPVAMASRSLATPSGFRRGLKKYSKYSSPRRSSRSLLTPRSTVCSSRVATTRLVR